MVYFYFIPFGVELDGSKGAAYEDINIEFFFGTLDLWDYRVLSQQTFKIKLKKNEKEILLTSRWKLSQGFWSI